MKFDDTAIEEYKFNQNKSPILINDVTIAINVLYVKKEKYIPLMFQNITKVVKNKLFF